MNEKNKITEIPLAVDKPMKNKGGRPKGSRNKKGTKTRSAEKQDKVNDKDLIKMTSTYLLSNFYKFNEEKKLRIALAVQSKAIKQTVQHDGFSFMNLVKITNQNKEKDINGRVRTENLRRNDTEVSKESGVIPDGSS